MVKGWANGKWNPYANYDAVHICQAIKNFCSTDALTKFWHVESSEYEFFNTTEN